MTLKKVHVAAASNAAKFWLKRGGFKTVLSTEKIGHIHFTFKGEKIFKLF